MNTATEKQQAPATYCGNCHQVTYGGILRGALIYCLPCAKAGYPEAYAGMEATLAANYAESDADTHATTGVHTATWRVVEFNKRSHIAHDWPVEISYDNILVCTMPTKAQNPAGYKLAKKHAQQIVGAVNNHAQLVAALKLMVESYVRSDDNGIAAQHARAALAQIEGGQK